MGTTFNVGQTLVRGDLDIFLTNSLGNPTNAYTISYAIFFVTPQTQEEVLIGPAARTPVNPAVGEYYASLMIPSNATPGCYRIRWLFRETASSPEEGVVQEFGVIAETPVAGAALYSACVLNLIQKMRTLTGDNCLAEETLVEVMAGDEKMVVSLGDLYQIVENQR